MIGACFAHYPAPGERPSVRRSCGLRLAASQGVILEWNIPVGVPCGFGQGWSSKGSVGVTRQYCGQVGKQENRAMEARLNAYGRLDIKSAI
jgi:hypothetical protein